MTTGNCNVIESQASLETVTVRDRVTSQKISDRNHTIMIIYVYYIINIDTVTSLKEMTSQ